MPAYYILALPESQGHTQLRENQAACVGRDEVAQRNPFETLPASREPIWRSVIVEVPGWALRRVASRASLYDKSLISISPNFRVTNLKHREDCEVLIG